MHDSSYEKMAAFVSVHLAAHRGQPLEVLDFGSQVVDDQGLSYRGLFDDPLWSYRGLDIEAGNNVDIIVKNAYDWSEVPSDSVDLVISGQALEHVEYFWASMFEIVRALRPGGLAVIIAPSGGFEHRYPVDCWRFYRDGFTALANYVGCDVIDTFTDWGNLDWEDSILVARKPISDAEGRERFDRRSALQRALLADSPVDLAALEPSGAADEPTPSRLDDVTTGALTAELDSARERRTAEQVAAATAAADSQRAAADSQRAELDELRAHVEALHAQPGALQRLYGTVRAQVAGLAGGRGRQAYKRLRGRG